MKRSPASLRRMPPSPRAASDSRMPMPTMPVGMELEELHVLQRHAVPIRQGHAVAGQREGVGGDREHPAEAARREHDRRGAEDVQLAVRDPVGHDAAASRRPRRCRSTTWYSSKNSTSCLMHCWYSVCRIMWPVRSAAKHARRTGRLAEVAGVATEAALVDLAVGRPVERQAHVLELDDRLDRPRAPGSRPRPGRRGSRRP